MNTYFNNFSNDKMSAEAIMMLADSMASAAASFNTQTGYDQFLQSRQQLGEALESIFSEDLAD